MSAHSMAIIEVRCDAIQVGERHRKDLGELEGLAASIATEGLLQPIGITEESVLVFGERRLRAFQDVLRQETIPARIVHVGSISAGEYAENEIRKDFTPSERVAIGKALEAEVGDRQGQRTDTELPEHIPEVEPGMEKGACPITELPKHVSEVEPGVETREFAARKAGFGNYKTYEQAKRVVEKAVEEVVAQMDSGDLSVSAASVIAEQPPERQREIARLPEEERRAAVRKLRRKDLPTPAAARREALDSDMAILDRNLNYQLPTPESQRPLVERNYAAMAVVDAARAISGCQHSTQEIAAAIRSLDTPDVDFAGHCRRAAAFLKEINQELECDENK
jgi:hypothetical protein